jgi:2-polyprenyl-6-methoxyphenol hydroxylase-like FAD-dependent oxidoreductase
MYWTLLNQYNQAKAGAKVTVIERFPNLRPGGQSIDIRTVGVSVMRLMPGMEAAVRSKMTSLEGMSFVRNDGRPYGTIKPTGNPDQQSLVSEYEIFRGDLSQILYDLTAHDENVEYVFNEQIESIQQSEKDDGPVRVAFKNHLPSSDFDLVVACDGATSRTRAMGMICGSRDFVHPVNSWSAWFSMEGDLLNGQNVGLAYSAPCRFIALGPDPAGKTRVALMGVHRRSDQASILPFRDAMSKGTGSLKQYVDTQFRGIGWKSDQAMDGMMKAEDFYASEMVQIKLPKLYNGRFTLVGDAGYASGPTGGGTSLAMVGGYILAGEISKHPDDLASGLEAYEERMRPIIEDMQKIPPLAPWLLAPETNWGIWTRNQIFAFITWSGVLDIAQRFFASAFADNDRHPLPQYDWER